MKNKTAEDILNLKEENPNLKLKMINWKIILILLLLLILVIFLILTIIKPKECKNISINDVSLNEGLILYYQFNNDSYYKENDKIVCDLSGNNNKGYVYNSKWNSTGGYVGDGAFEFNGIDSLIKIKDNKLLSPNTSGGNFSVSFFIKFKNTNFIGEGSGKNYINFLGKGSKKEGYEWLFREYNSSNSENRSNRISFYSYNSEGGIGVGSYFQDNIGKEWIYVTGVLDKNQIKIYKNGVLRNTQILKNISLIDTKSDLYIGTMTGDIYLNGSIDELRIYNKPLNDSEVKKLYSFTISALYPE